MNYKFKINDFEGPLDLLLYLVKDAKMDIFNIEIVKLTDQYLQFINEMEELSLIIASEYLTLAAELIYLKSKSLLPNMEKEEEDNTFEEEKNDLQNRLIEYEKYKKMVDELKKLEDKRKEIYTKIPSNLKEYKTNEIKLNEDISLKQLLDAFESFLERQKLNEPISAKITNTEISIDERILGIKKLLNIKKRIEFTELFDELNKPYIIITFLSILEMAKKHQLKLTQDNNFDKIYCEVI